MLESFIDVMVGLLLDFINELYEGAISVNIQPLNFKPFLELNTYTGASISPVLLCIILVP